MTIRATAVLAPVLLAFETAGLAGCSHNRQVKRS
jgi:hypothetical protein